MTTYRELCNRLFEKANDDANAALEAGKVYLYEQRVHDSVRYLSILVNDICSS